MSINGLIIFKEKSNKMIKLKLSIELNYLFIGKNLWRGALRLSFIPDGGQR